jgi:hypothetical protein
MSLRRRPQLRPLSLDPEIDNMEIPVSGRFDRPSQYLRAEDPRSRKRTYSEEKNNIFEMEFRSKEIGKVPLGKMFMRDKLFFITNLPRNHVVKES